MKRFLWLEVFLLVFACGLFAAGVAAESPASTPIPTSISTPVLTLPPSPILPLPVPFSSPLPTRELRIKYLRYDEQGIAIVEVAVSGGETKTVGLLEGVPVRIQIWDKDGKVLKDFHLLLSADGNIRYKEKEEDQWTRV